MAKIQTKKLSMKNFRNENADTYGVIIARMRLYKAGEIAEILRVSIGTVYRLGREGKLKRVKVGRSVRFALPEMEEWNDE